MQAAKLHHIRVRTHLRRRCKDIQQQQHSKVCQHGSSNRGRMQDASTEPWFARHLLLWQLVRRGEAEARYSMRSGRARCMLQDAAIGDRVL
jgi:hypothetical protein